MGVSFSMYALVGHGSYVEDISSVGAEKLRVFCRKAETKTLNKIWKKVTVRSTE